MPLLAVRGNGPAGAYGFGAASEKPAAMTAIASNTLGADAATVTFSSISGNYDDLMIVCYWKNTGTLSDTGQLRLNGDTATNYSLTYLNGNGATATSGRFTNNNRFDCLAGSGLPSNTQTDTFAVTTWNIFNYANTSYNKTILCRTAGDRNGSGESELSVGLWRSTSAVTSVTLTSGYSLKTGSVFALYGIKKAA